MEIPQDILTYCESCYKWDDDVRQEVYMKIMSMPEDAEINKAWCLRVYANLFMDIRKVEGNRTRLREDNYDLIVRNLGLEGTDDDPHDIAAADQLILKHLKSLSALLRYTLVQYYVEGRSPEDIAEADNENVEAVRKRITRARNLLKGE